MALFPYGDFLLIIFTLEYKKMPASAIPVPRELIGAMGVRKKRMEATITTTRFTQFPTECVTGDICSSNIYPAC
jgi:hypothetical protein